MPTEQENDLPRIDPRLDSYDWTCAFEYAGGGGYCWDCDNSGLDYDEEGLCPECNGRPSARYGHPRISGVLGYTGSTEGFDRVDVEEIIALIDGANDAENWLGVFKLRDGRWASLRAGCDYTGWDCQASGNANVADSLDAILRWGLGDDERERLIPQLRLKPDIAVALDVILQDILT